MNRVLLTAQLLERAVMRYTPAGLPALDVRLVHASQVEHAGKPRQVSMEIHATAIGDVALDLGQLAVGTTAEFTGFLGKQRYGKGVMLHISAFVSSPQSPESN
jgi:primosomal replication protein N